MSSVREDLRTYSKGDLTRIAVLATRKQHAAEEALRDVWRRFWSVVVMTAVLAFAAGGGVVWWVWR
jgi:hypothetical protein